jgi:hypothetical protein
MDRMLFSVIGILVENDDGWSTIDAVRKLGGSSDRILTEAPQRDFSFEIEVRKKAELTSAASGLVGATLSFLAMAMVNVAFVLA